MNRHAADYLQEASRYSRHGWNQGKKLSRRASESAAGASNGTMVAGLAVRGLVVGAWLFAGSDLIRYLKMKRM